MRYSAIAALSGLLACQLILVIIFTLSSGNLIEQSAEVDLLSFEAKSVTRLVIRDNNDKAISMIRSADGWLISMENDFPADNIKVDALLNQLTKIKRGLFIATSDSAAKRFRVAENAFERKVTLESNDGVLATLYLGTSQGTRQIHIRQEGQSGVSQIPLSIWSVPTDTSDWIKSTILQLDPQSIIALSWNGTHIERVSTQEQKEETEKKKSTIASEGGQNIITDSSTGNNQSNWHLTSVPDRVVPNDVVDRLMGYISRILVNKIISSDEYGNYDSKNPLLVLKIQLKDNKNMTYKLLKSSKNSGYAIIASNWIPWMRIPDITAERLIQSIIDPIFNVEKSSRKLKSNTSKKTTK